MSVVYTHVESPIGPLLLAADGRGLSEIHFPVHGRPAAPRPGWHSDRAPLRETIRQLERYFAGSLRQFDLPLAPQGTPFQLDVWRALLRIPYGSTISYGELARGIGRPAASRAVGAANGRNPLPIVVPCHRVIGADGSMTGFGGGIAIKRALLDLERGAALPFAP
jgi:methylated-DNA-[protein]-cysteine S-methyltransferase